MNVNTEMKGTVSASETVPFFNLNKNTSCVTRNLFTRKEAAKYLGISLATLDAARNSGLITYVQYVENGCVFFTETALQEYIARSTHRASPRKENMETYRKKRN
ncbi:hypothetical protein SAMN04487760_11174 [Lachnospiraceae bacterium G41]|nr:hypothetical protein SAMN04487760_11174 [Lachnospiraceae bacterium G41]